MCNLCNGAVRFVLRHERDHELRFASLQSPFGQRVLDRYPEARAADSLVLLDGAAVYLRSDAVLRLGRHLREPWRTAAATLATCPRSLRDWCYRLVAASRYRVFGRRDACMVPTPAQRLRFLDGQESLAAPPNGLAR